MTTKNRIIRASIILFNEYGVAKVSLRQIATEVGISHGNLAYHYKNKKIILHEIYTHMDKAMATAIYPDHTEINLTHYHHLLHRVHDFQRQHRFFYMDIVEISRRYPDIIQRYRDTIRTRGEQTRKLFDTLIEKKLIKPEQEPEFYQSIAHALWVMSTFWLQQEYILGPDHPATATGSDIKHIWEVLLPHLTAKGLKEYHNLKNHMA